jgi:hypothetical protein
VFDRISYPAAGFSGSRLYRGCLPAASLTLHTTRPGGLFRS